MEEQFNREAKEGWRFAADAARITDERAGSEGRKHTSDGVFVAVESNLGTVVGEGEGSQATRDESPKHGKMCEDLCEFFRCTSGTRKFGPRGTRPCWRGSVEASQSHQKSVADGM